MLQDRMLIEVAAPADVSTHTLLTADLTDAGLSADVLAACAARAVSKRDASGNGKVFDDIVAVSGSNLTITEGSTGFVAGDVWTIELVFPAPVELASVATTPGG